MTKEEEEIYKRYTEVNRVLEDIHINNVIIGQYRKDLIPQNDFISFYSYLKNTTAPDEKDIVEQTYQKTIDSMDENLKESGYSEVSLKELWLLTRGLYGEHDAKDQSQKYFLNYLSKREVDNTFKKIAEREDWYQHKIKQIIKENLEIKEKLQEAEDKLTINSMVANAKINPPAFKDDIDMNEVIKLKKGGMPVNKIAQQVGCSYNKLKYRLKKANLM